MRRSGYWTRGTEVETVRPPEPDRLQEAIDALANALQSAVLLSGRLRAQFETGGQDAAALHDAITRAVSTLKTLQPNARGGDERA